jgi:amidase
MPTPAYRHDHSPEQEKRRITIDGKEYVYPDQLAWPGIATFPGLPSTAIPTGFAPDGRSACRSSGPGWRTRRR